MPLKGNSGDSSALVPQDVATVPETPDVVDRVEQRRREIDAKQAEIAEILQHSGCDACVLFQPAHVAWFTGGIHFRGLLADSERPVIFTNGEQRWILCADSDSRRLFDEDLDQLGFQLKEWRWNFGRSALISELCGKKKIASDRSYGRMTRVEDSLHLIVRRLAATDRRRYRDLGLWTAHAVEAAARTCEPGQTEHEIAGQIAHRLLHHGVEAHAITVVADGLSEPYRRAGFTARTVTRSCYLQVTGSSHGLFATTGRMVTFETPSPELRSAHDAAILLSAAYRLMTAPGESFATATEAGRAVIASLPAEHEWAFNRPGYGTGWTAAEELRLAGEDEPFLLHQAITWQARVGPTAVVDTFLAREPEPVAITPLRHWPYKTINTKEHSFDVPDLLVR